MVVSSMTSTRVAKLNRGQRKGIKIMGTTNVTLSANGVEVLKPQKTMFDLDTMEEVTAVKVIEFKPVADTKEALERLGNDSAKFLEVVNRGLRTEVQESAKADASIPWQVEDEEGKLTPFTGTPANMAGVNNLVLSLAKQVFGYTKDAKLEAKRAAKESAIAMIRASDQIREGLKKTAALEDSSGTAPTA